MVFNFDMDGTIADLYGNENWLNDLINENPKPYANAKPLLDMNRLAKALNKVKSHGHKIVILSWGSKNGSKHYLKAVTKAKEKWLRQHLKSVEWNAIKVVPYGTPKETLSSGILFDDEQRNLDNWGANAYTPNDIFEVLAQY